MRRVEDLLSGSLTVINVGIPAFRDHLEAQGQSVAHVEWRPPAWGDPELLQALDKLLRRPEVEEANKTAVERLINSRPVVIDIAKARDVIPGMTERLLLHAGPPIGWEDMCGPMRGAIMGVLVYEGRARDTAEGARRAAAGALNFSPCHEHAAVGPMAGIVSPSMPVFVVENQTYGNRVFCPLNEGIGKMLRYGANSPEVIARLKWMETVLAPALGAAIRSLGGIDLRLLIAQALHMGDEGHNRNKAGTSLFIRTVATALAGSGLDPADVQAILRFMDGNDHFFLNLSMPAAKAMADAAHGIPSSTVVTTMARNGTAFGIRVSGLGDSWFTAPAERVEGLYFPGYTADDANPDIGDSAITETVGLGGFAMAGAPAIVRFVGGSVAQASAISRAMYDITVAENPHFTIPNLDFRGAPTGIDIRKAGDLALLPQINTGIAHKEPGVGQVGAGLVKPPRECFRDALLAMWQRLR
ncbi:MAG: DUF1116 domain-containing protein [Candidatus Methylomirabilia bacterium]